MIKQDRNSTGSGEGRNIITKSNNVARLLANCPFCGNYDLSFRSAGDARSTAKVVVCNECDAEGPTAITAPKAGELWNARTPKDRGDAEGMEISAEWTDEERLTVVNMIATEMMKSWRDKGIIDVAGWAQRLAFVACEPAEFLEANRRNIFTNAIKRQRR